MQGFNETANGLYGSCLKFSLSGRSNFWNASLSSSVNYSASVGWYIGVGQIRRMKVSKQV